MTAEQMVLAPLVRGLMLHITGKPCVVIEGAELGDQTNRSLEVDIAPALNGKRVDPTAAAKLLSQSYMEWVQRQKAASDGCCTLPGAIRVWAGNRSINFWIGETLDAARQRRSKNDFSAWRLEPARRKDALATARGSVVKGRIALVTGGAQGFGEEIVRGLTGSGALVFIADLNLEGASELAERLNSDVGRTVAVPVGCNVADEASVEAMFALISSTAGGLDLCVSNAGVLRAGSVLDLEANDFRFVTEVNYTAFFLVTKHAARLLRSQSITAPGWMTDIVQINSKSGLEGSNKNGAYAGGKFGGIGLVQSYALELIEYGIKVNAICPGNFFDGPLWSDPEKGLFVQYLAAGKVPGAETVEDVKASYESKVPMGRGCTGADVMRALYYLIEQAYETGQALPVTGGQVMLR